MTYSILFKLINPVVYILIWILCILLIIIDFFLNGSNKSKKRRHRLTQIERRKLRENLNEKLEKQPIVVIDAYFTNFMESRGKTSFAKQMSLVHAINRESVSPFNIEVVNFNYSQEYSGSNITVFPYKYFSDDVLNHHSLNELIYLSPDSDNVMDKYENDKIYIIGGIIDRTISKNESLNRAKELKIKTMRLPLKEKITIGKPSLNIDIVFEILLTLKNNNNNWNEALKCIPLKNRSTGNPKDLKPIENYEDLCMLNSNDLFKYQFMNVLNQKYKNDQQYLVYKTEFNQNNHDFSDKYICRLYFKERLLSEAVGSSKRICENRCAWLVLHGK